MFDFKTIIKDFPILNRKINEKKLIYFDNAATSQKPKVVIDALSNFYSNTNANIHRGVHTLSMESTYLYDEAKDKIAEFINAPNSNSIIFTRGTTESLNLIADSWGQSNLKEPDNIVITELEHHSNIVPWQELIKKTKSKLKYIPINSDGTLNLSNINNIITKNTKLVSMTHVSNGIGTINNIKEIIKIAKSVGAITIIDAAQSAPHMPLDVADLDCDFLTFSGHKMLAPTGIGVLYGKKEILEAMPPYQKGGDMILEVTFDKSTWNEIPFKFEAGTPNIAGAIGLSAATKYLMERMFTQFEQDYPQTKFRIVRYGNVLYSTGSVLCIWKDKLQNGEEIIITDPNATRYFWTLDQAVDLIFDCMENATNSQFHFPSMKSMSMGNLLDAMAEKYLPEGKELKVKTIGLQVGENLHEKISEDGLYSNEAEQFTIEEIKELI